MNNEALFKMYTLKQIETPRLIIRPVNADDAIPLNESINHSLRSLQKWMPWAQDPSLETTKKHIESNLLSRQSKTFTGFSMVIIHKEGQKIIGGTGYNEQSKPDDGIYEIGYWCDIDYQGHGYVTEAVNAQARYALKELQAKLIALRIACNNMKSIEVAKRSNFENQGVKPSVTENTISDYYFTCKNIEKLPPLDVSWNYSHEEK